MPHDPSDPLSNQNMKDRYYGNSDPVAEKMMKRAKSGFTAHNRGSETERDREAANTHTHTHTHTRTHARTHTRTHILQATISLSPSISHQCCMCAVLRLTASKIEAPEDKTITTLCIRGLKPEYGITEQDVRCALLLLAAAQRCLVQLFGMAVWCARVLSHAWDVCCWALL